MEICHFLCKTNAVVHTVQLFFGHPGCSAFAYTIPFGTLDASLRPGGGVWGRWAPKLVGRHRDLNPGPPACESGVVTITLRGPPPPSNLFTLIFCRIRSLRRRRWESNDGETQSVGGEGGKLANFLCSSLLGLSPPVFLMRRKRSFLTTS